MRAVLALALPALIQHLLNTAVFIADRAMLGDYATESLAAMQIAGPLRWASYSIFTAFSAGTVAVVARHIGAGDQVRARAAAAASLVFSLVMGALLSAVILILPQIVSLYRPEPAVASEAHAYLLTVLAIAPATSFTLIAVFVLQAAGDTRTPMLITMLANLINIAGNWLLIGGNLGLPALGALGAGLASAAAILCELILLVYVLARGRSRIRVGLGDLLASSRRHLRPILAISIPSAIEQVIFHSGFFLFTVIVGRLGLLAMAANQAAVSVESVCFLTADAFGIAAATLVGQRLGANRPDAADEAARAAARLGAGLLLFASITILFGRELLLSMFTTDTVAVAIGALAIEVGILELPFLGLAGVLGRALRGAGETRTPLLVTAIGVWGLRVPLSWWLGIEMEMGLPGIWAATLVDWVVRALILWWAWRRGAWRRIEIQSA